jgi:D-sedoheptulose 7-phosphate isomerase
MKKTLKKIFYDSADIKKKFIDSDANVGLVLKCAKIMRNALKAGGKILFFGNGGSAADAQHLAAEFVNRFSIDRAPLAALALTTDTSVITSISNDSNFVNVYSRQVSALGKKNDVAFGISTSGNSTNVIKALLEAKRIGMFTVALTGNNGGKMKDIADMNINIASKDTPRVQEVHITIGHALCYLVETGLKKYLT